MRFSIKQRIMLFVTVMFLAANIFTFYQEYTNAKDSLNQSYDLKYKLASSFIAEEIARYKNTYKKKAEFFLSLDGISKAVEEHNKNKLIDIFTLTQKKFFIALPHTKSISFYDLNNNPIAYFSQNMKNKMIPTHYFIQSRKLDDGIEMTDQQIILNVYKNIYSNGLRVGTLQVSVDITQVLYLPLKHLKNLEMAILDTDNKVFSQSKHYANQNKKGEFLNIENNEILLDVDANTIGSIKFRFNITKEVKEQNKEIVAKFIPYLIIFVLFLFILDFNLNHYLNIIDQYKEDAKAILNTQPNLIIALRNSKVTQINQAFEDFFEVNSIEEFYEKHKSLSSIFIPTKELQNVTNDKEWYEYLKLHRKTTLKIQTSTNHEYVYELFSKPLSSNHETIIITFQNVTELFQESKTNYDLAHMDELTGIYNRKFLNKTLEDMVHKNEKFSLLMLDIDHFKAVNDTYGHDVGDEVLKALAKTVQGSIRDKDIFCRWGGEEFMIVLKGAYIDSIEMIANKIRKNIEEMHFKDIPQITSSFGATVYLPNDSSYTLIKRADNALYESKETGRNKVTLG